MCVNDDDNHHRLDSQHNCGLRKGGGLYDHLMSTRAYILVMSKRSHVMSSEIMRNLATALFYIF